ncbi:flagellum-specific peptidoglycan hydrolase FlgJ [Hydrogenispora ethanolica]|uniref:Flagellum-specific peptidoglycan hydrolase FlgJ n=1 Tax=Hydrogenispora ethanolica TaxID=1082276 RepID=A0A4R1RC22_HYDET|nr:glucosaminidase domain-containing protein [Hydrogenispora ethanolica]TCL63338.1 flagellum-specific peptidoglycan hydrolase FlgJ [Hydrogenispora ethanolica]
MKQKKSFQLVIFSMTLIVLAGTGIVHAALFQPLPYEDRVRGRNSYAYNPAIGHPTYNEQVSFINSIKNTAISASSVYGIPASAIIGMACVEGGYGFTRSAYYANNIFGIKVWAQNPEGGWQLKGQPDEDGGRVPVIASHGGDRLIFREDARYDNWYRRFASRTDAIHYLGGLITRKYQPARANYQRRIAAGWSYAKASKQFCREIADLGYNHLGGNYYEGKIGAVMDRWNLYQYDRRAVKDDPGSRREDRQPQHRRFGRINISADSGKLKISIKAGD